MKKTQVKIQLSEEIFGALGAQGDAIGGQSANTLAAMVLAEFSRVRPASGAIFEALGRIHEEGERKAVATGATARAGTLVQSR